MKLFPLDRKSPAKPAKQKKQVALEKSLRLHTRRGPATAAEAV
jgi:hypothetical protein